MKLHGEVLDFEYQGTSEHARKAKKKVKSIKRLKIRYFNSNWTTSGQGNVPSLFFFCA